MQKIFSLFAAILFAGSIFAADAKVVLDFKDAGWNFPTDYVQKDTTYTNGGFTIALPAASKHKLILDGGNPKALLFGKKDATLTLPAMDFNVSKIILKGATSSSGKVTFNIFVDESAVSTEAKSSLEDHDFAIATASQTAGTIYVIKVTNENNCQISAVEFYEAVADAPEDPTFSVPGGIYSAAQSVELACETEGAEIFYTLDGSTPTASSTQYDNVAIEISETTTIKAVAIKNSVSSDVVAATYKIVSLEGEGTKENPYTIADLAKLENPGVIAWVQGYILGGLNGQSPKVIDNTQAAIIALGATADATEFIPVQLPTGDVRAALNVVDNAGNIGRFVKVKGSLEAYCGTTGVKSTSDFELGAPTAIDETNADVKAVKTIENGRLVIIKNNVRFDATGTRL